MSHSHEQIYLLTIRGTLAPPSLEAARQVHNQTAIRRCSTEQG